MICVTLTCIQGYALLELYQVLKPQVVQVQVLSLQVRVQIQVPTSQVQVQVQVLRYK